MKNLRSIAAVVGLAALISGSAGCSTLSSTASSTPSASPDTAAIRSALAANHPRVDGSTTTGPLARLLLCDLLAIPCVWSAPASANTERTYIPDPAATVSATNTATITDLKFSTTHNAYINLIDGKTDVLLEARLPSPDELAAAKAKGVEFDTQPFALDAFVFLVNNRNSTTTMPLATLRDIYSGKITTWKAAGVDVGNVNAGINAYQREPNSGSQELMKSMVMASTPMINAPNMVVQTMAGPYNAIGGNPQTGVGGDSLGLGFSVYYYAAVMFNNPQVKMIGVDGVTPSSDTISSRAYPLTAPVYLVTRKDAAAGSSALLYRDWLLSPDGQRVIKLSGYVPVTPPTR